MKPYDESKAEMEAIQQQMVHAKKNECASVLKKKIKHLRRKFGFTTRILKGAMAEGRKKQ
jgi:hypothetical protein